MAARRVRPGRQSRGQILPGHWEIEREYRDQPIVRTCKACNAPNFTLHSRRFPKGYTVLLKFGANRGASFACTKCPFSVVYHCFHDQKTRAALNQGICTEQTRKIGAFGTFMDNCLNFSSTDNSGALRDISDGIKPSDTSRPSRELIALLMQIHQRVRAAQPASNSQEVHSPSADTSTNQPTLS